MKFLYKFSGFALYTAVALLQASCDDNFMERYPTTVIAPDAFFNSTNDLELYTNTFYTHFDVQTNDGPGDNICNFSNVSSHIDLLRGTVSANNGGSDFGDWSKVRTYNYLLQNADKPKGNQSEIDHYVGLTRLMRAIWYYDCVKAFNEVPYIDHVLAPDDPDIYKKRDSREYVMERVMEDLDYACTHMNENYGNRTVMSRWFALAIKSRICLSEGSWRKYHPELNLQQSADSYFTQAAAAAKEVIDSHVFSIDKNGGANSAYMSLFSSSDLSSSPEIILFQDYNKDKNICHSASNFCEDNIGLSRMLMESYEYVHDDGSTVPFCSVPGYDKMEYVEVFKNRDPRLAQTFCPPGYMYPGDTRPLLPKLNLGGYPQRKFFVTKSDERPRYNSANDLPIMRYAEVLLNYAEARAELSQLTQEDVNITLNEIRSRVGLPGIDLNDLPNDANLTAQYPDITDKKILQIRRERRVELACEGFRWNDCCRWGAGHLLGEVPQGVYIKQFGVYDYDGDGVPECGVFKNEGSNTVPEADRGNYVYQYCESGGFALSDGDSGFVYSINNASNKFEAPKYYYWPLSTQQLTLNPDFGQTIYW